MAKGQRAALVTGGGRGIGQAIALYLAQKGNNVYVNDYNQSNLQNVLEIASKMGLELKPLPFDISNEEQIKSSLRQIECLDYLVNNAGVCPHLNEQEITGDVWDYIFSINAKGTYFCSKHAAEKMKPFGKGSIVNISSGASKTGGAYVSAPYAASKAAINSITFSFAKKLAPYGIRVNAVAPGFIESSILNTMPIDYKEIQKEIPLGRVGTAEDVASCVGFLLSDEASFITGEIIDVNGGDLMD